tara:strand:- start:3055 stop:4134 length:1080 start_codon:yes stop_codon:yes gene_type:complete
MNFLLIDKYLITSFLKKLLNILTVFLVIFLVVDIIDHIDKILDNPISFTDISMIYIYSIPQYINIAFPMAILISTVMTMSLLQKNNEITALKASGVSIYRLTAPFFITGFFLCIGIFYFENLIVTESNIIKSELEKKYFSKKTNSNKNMKTDDPLHQLLGENKVIVIDKFDHNRKTARNVSIQEFADNTLMTRMDINKLIWNNNTWIAENLIYREFDNNVFSIIPDSTISIEITPIDLVQSNIDPDEMNYWSLKTYIERLKKNNRNYKKWLVDLNFKTAFLFSNILMILFGIALTIKNPRSNFLSGVGASIFIIFIYYVMIKTGQTMGYNEVVSPFLSVWIPNFLFLFSGLFLLFKTRT